MQHSLPSLGRTLMRGHPRGISGPAPIGRSPAALAPARRRRCRY
jgi:hypothetical protein